VTDDWPALPDETAAEPWLPLAGVRVLDLSRILAGPFASMVLADLGADVIKVERPGGDDTRRWGPPFHGADAAYFLSVNRSRRSLALDLEDPEGLEILARLARSADLVIENFLPAQLERLGLSRLRGDNPQLRWVSIRSAGSEGPLASRPGFDAMVQARSGLMSITGHEQPTKIGVALADVITGLYAAVAALALLRDGDEVTAEVPLFECALAALVNQAANHLVGGRTPGLFGNEHPNLVPYGSFACADGEIVVGAGTDRQFTALCGVLGRPELADDVRFASNDVRIANRHALNAVIDEALRARPIADWAERLDEAGIPWAPINDIAAAFAEPHVGAVGLVEFVDTPDGPLAQVRSPITLGGRPLPVRFAPPALGADNKRILAELGVLT
jgi:crotonobetainyl-CoA:carnitine CoA-transferase CaiB-like acyl-CoA transferase